MPSESVRTAADAHHLTRQRREERADAAIEVPANDRAEITCPECGVSTTALFAGGSELFPSFSNCWSWDCDAFLKFVWDGSDGRDDGPEQVDLAAFAGGE